MITSGFFNSVNGDRKYTAEQIGRYFDKIIGNGVFANPSTNLQVFESNGMSIKVSAGRGWVDSHWLDNDADYIMNLQQSNMVYPRIDCIIMKLNTNESARSLTIEIKQGEPSASPVAPTMERSENVKEYCLAEITVGANTTQITQANIKDTRANTTVCGWVTSLVDQVDTSTLFAQWETAYQEYFDTSSDEMQSYFDEQKKIFDDWFNNLKENLSTSTLVREFSSRYVTTKQDEVDIPIGVASYVQGLDILDVYINGLRLVKDIEYTDNMTYITLAKPLDINQPVEFVVFKSVDGKDAIRLLDIVEDMEKDLLSRGGVMREFLINVSDWNEQKQATLNLDYSLSQFSVLEMFPSNEIEGNVDLFTECDLKMVSNAETSVTIQCETIPSDGIVVDIEYKGERDKRIVKRDGSFVIEEREG